MPVVGTTRRFALLEKDVEVQLDLAQMLLEQAEQIQKQLDHEKDHCEHNAGNVSGYVPRLETLLDRFKLPEEN
jgi:hypothetical protein